MKKKKYRLENGMITVEAVLTLVPFLMVVLGIISFINIYMVHNKIQYALFQAASELSAYTYLYEALGIRDADGKLQADIERETEDVDRAIELTTDFFTQLKGIGESFQNFGKNGIDELETDMDELYSNAENTVETGKELVTQSTKIARDPETIIHYIVYKGIEEGENFIKSWLGGELAGGLVDMYIEQSYSPTNPMSADGYLRAFGVVNGARGLDYGNSKLFQDSKHRMIDIVVEYDIEVQFFKLFLKDPTVHMVQRCTIPAWLDGDGGSF